MVFAVDHDFEGPRAPTAHLDTVNRNLSHDLAPPFISHAGPAWPEYLFRLRWLLDPHGEVSLQSSAEYRSQRITPCTCTARSPAARASLAARLMLSSCQRVRRREFTPPARGLASKPSSRIRNDTWNFARASSWGSCTDTDERVAAPY